MKLFAEFPVNKKLYKKLQNNEKVKEMLSVYKPNFIFNPKQESRIKSFKESFMSDNSNLYFDPNDASINLRTK